MNQVIIILVVAKEAVEKIKRPLANRSYRAVLQMNKVDKRDEMHVPNCMMLIDQDGCIKKFN